MKAVLYTRTYRLTDGEQELRRRLENQGVTVKVSNGQFFERFHEADAVYSDLDHIREAAEGKGIEAHPCGSASGRMIEKEKIVTHQVKGGGWADIFVDGDLVETVRTSEVEEAIARHR